MPRPGTDPWYLPKCSLMVFVMVQVVFCPGAECILPRYAAMVFCSDSEPCFARAGSHGIFPWYRLIDIFYPGTEPWYFTQVQSHIVLRYKVLVFCLQSHGILAHVCRHGIFAQVLSHGILPEYRALVFCPGTEP
jgi:hypothetical protein